MPFRRLFAALALLLFAATVASAEEKPLPAPDASVTVGSGIRYQRLAHWDSERLNRILTTDFPAFAGIVVPYSPARTAVTLYRITYPSVIPEQGNRPTVASACSRCPTGLRPCCRCSPTSMERSMGNSRFPRFPTSRPKPS